jgi:putative DNA primase/helicase
MEIEELRANIQRNTALTPAIVEATMKALRSKHHASIAAAPAWLNDPKRRATNLVSFLNGVLDIDKWIMDPATPLMPHDSKLFTLATLPINYNPAATCPTFDRWLPTVFPGDTDQQAEYLKMLGYLFIDGNPYHKMFVLLGRPRSGKGISQRLMQALVGPKNAAATNLTLLGSQFGLANLVGKRLAIIGEMNEQKHTSIATAAIDALKGISGGDTLGVDRKNHSIVEMALPVRFVCACNRMPAFLDPSGALADRIVLFKFNVSYSGVEDPNLEPQLHNEMAGIVNRALAGLRALQLTDHGFKASASIKTEPGAYRRTEISADAYKIVALEALAKAGNGGLLRQKGRA